MNVITIIVHRDKTISYSIRHTYWESHQNDVTVIEYINRDNWLDYTITYSLYIKHCHTHTHTHTHTITTQCCVSVINNITLWSIYIIHTHTHCILLCSWEVKLLNKLWTNVRPLRAISDYYHTGLQCSTNAHVYTEELT